MSPGYFFPRSFEIKKGRQIIVTAANAELSLSFFKTAHMYVYILRLWLHNYIIIMWSVPCQIILGLRTHFILLFHRFSLCKAVHYRLLYTMKIAKLQQHWLSHQYIVVKETRPASLKTGQSQRYELWSDLCLPMAILQQKMMTK